MEEGRPRFLALAAEAFDAGGFAGLEGVQGVEHGSGPGTVGGAEGVQAIAQGVVSGDAGASLLLGGAQGDGVPGELGEVVDGVAGGGEVPSVAGQTGGIRSLSLTVYVSRG
ncbi:hypothetical protein [Streptomyces sp. CBMA123]|uniref:hypothetical protein n=1 Tax=Streptomyces sp. CBMA123 TaxID=1896313 RepID=UPI001661B784|nr:hypothetical protein [Streptomyces sp. CBMA123]